MRPLRTNVYIDGFNFYYGCVKDTRYKWVDFRALCGHLLNPALNEINEIKYFSARVAARGDPRRPTRQDTYHRAIRAADRRLTIVLGHFVTNEVVLPRADGRGSARVVRTEEKGSDVNLASHLLRDAFIGNLECAVLVTNDSDLIEPVRIVRRELGLPVGILFPIAREGRRLSMTLAGEADFVRRIRQGVVRRSLLPDPVRSANGEIAKPEGW